MKILIKPLQLGLILALGGLSGIAQAAFTTFETSGANAAAITPTVNSFQSTLGTLNANNGTHQTSGRREINWDAVPDTAADPNLLAGDFFNSTTVGGRARGALLTTPGTGFMVSADSSNPTTTAPSFGFAADFVPFSGERLFAPVNSTITDITFFVPGTTIPATISGFGAVFNDVEIEFSTKIEVFNISGASLFSRNVLISSNGGMSFLGIVAAANEHIARVQITSGNSNLLSNGAFGSGADGVAMDDFIYSEPVPEPEIAMLLGMGLLAWQRRRQSKYPLKR